MFRLPHLAALLLTASLLPFPALAQTAASPAPASTPSTKPPGNPVLATVNGHPIHLSDLQTAAQELPSQMQQLPAQELFPLLLNQLIDRQVLLIAARSEKLQNDPQVAASMQTAADEKLENAYLQQQVGPQVTDAAIAAAYKKEYANKPGPEQVQARHILLKTKAEAEDVIAQLNKGADFAKLAQKYSIDPGAANGGELGWFSRNQMVPAFANAAFALQPGQYTKQPVQSSFGWHVILCEGKRTAPAPGLDQVKDQIAQELADNGIKAVLAKARTKVDVKVIAPPVPPQSSGSGGGVDVNLNPGGP